MLSFKSVKNLKIYKYKKYSFFQKCCFVGNDLKLSKSFILAMLVYYKIMNDVPTLNLLSHNPFSFKLGYCIKYFIIKF